MRVKVRFPVIGALPSAQFSVGLRSNNDESPRYAVSLVTGNSGTTNGANDPSLHIVGGRNYASVGTHLASTSLNGLVDLSSGTPIYIIARVNGTGGGGATSAYASLDGTAVLGSQISAASAPAAATGQVVLEVGYGDGNFVAQVDSFEVWQLNTVPAELSVFCAE